MSVRQYKFNRSACLKKKKKAKKKIKTQESVRLLNV